MTQTVLVIGSGGREHALAWALARDPQVVVHIAPGNPGTAAVGTNHPVDPLDGEAVAALAVELAADLVVVGPEAPLVLGVADDVRARGIPVFGPSAEAARLEGSKAFAKEIMESAGVPTADARLCLDMGEVLAALDEFGPPYVVKDDGLAAGKGVIVTDDRDAAIRHAASCHRVIVEEYLDGPEVSLFALSDGEHVLHCSPVSAAMVLRKLLWDEVDSVVMTSATLTGGGDFQALAIDNGIPEEAEMVSLASPFDLPNQAQLVVPPFPVTPDDRERHPKEVAKYLAAELDWDKGSIVLFTSRWKMEKVAELMPATQRRKVLVQGEGAKQKMIDEHLRRTAAGEGSVLFGLNSFGEGLDLPGEACTTVVITQVPFAVPTDPQTSTLSEWFESRGLNSFNLIAIPHALRTLTQFAGRLIRTSTDTGRVVILDSRLLTRRYGRRIIDALPPFRRVIG